jgi:hypothetical protein
MYVFPSSFISKVTALLDIFGLDTRDEALSLGLRLQRKGYLHHAYRNDDDGRSVFGDNSSYYLLRTFRYPHVLNALRTWDDKLTRIDTPVCVVHRLSKLWNALESRHLDDRGRVDHGLDFRNDDMLWRFEEDACELQGIRLTDMNDDTRLAVVINLYNVMIKYAFFRVGIPVSCCYPMAKCVLFPFDHVARCTRISLRIIVILKR